MFSLKGFLRLERKRDIFSRPVMRQLLLPMTAILLSLFALFVLAFWQQYRNALSQKLAYQQTSLMKEFRIDLENQAFGLRSTLLVFAEDPRLLRLLCRKNSPDFTEFAIWKPLFSEINQKCGITRFSFFDFQGNLLFRAHNPEGSGNSLEGPVFEKAKRTGDAAWGIELEPTGTFFLQVVQPVFREDRLLGYLELGKEIEDILRDRHGREGLLLVMVVRKNLLLRPLWEERMQYFGGEVRWDRLPHNVITYASRKDLSGTFFSVLNGALVNFRNAKEQKFFFEGKFWQLLFSPLRDASGQEVGSLVGFWDISLERREFLTGLVLTGLFGGGLFLVLLGCTIFFLSRADAKIFEQQRALEASRERFRLLTEDLPALVCEFAYDGSLLFANKAYCETFGMTSEDLPERHFLDFVSPEERNLVEKEYRSFARKKALGINVHRAVTERGIRWQEWRDRPLFNEHGRLVGYRAIGLDITERKEMQEKLQETNRSLQEAILQAQRANMAKSEFLANMSHEIRTPLHAVLGMGELLQETELSEEQQHYLNLLLASGDALLSLIEDILDFTKIEAGRTELKIQEFSLSELVETLTAPLEVQAREKGLKLSSEIAEEVPSRLRGDSGRLRQILTNLLGNAVKFTLHGTVTLRISREPEEEGTSAKFRFSVEDTGIGIPENKIPALFQRFSQLDSSSTRQYRGTGLGLAISKRLVELMGGTIHVESRMARGSKFWFVVPLEEGKTPEAP